MALAFNFKAYDNSRRTINGVRYKFKRITFYGYYTPFCTKQEIQKPRVVTVTELKNDLANFEHILTRCQWWEFLKRIKLNLYIKDTKQHIAHFENAVNSHFGMTQSRSKKPTTKD